MKITSLFLIFLSGVAFAKLPTTGDISLGDVNKELTISRTANIHLNQSNVRTLLATPSGEISLAKGRGKSKSGGKTKLDFKKGGSSKVKIKTRGRLSGGVDSSGRLWLKGDANGSGGGIETPTRAPEGNFFFEMEYVHNSYCSDGALWFSTTETGGTSFTWSWGSSKDKEAVGIFMNCPYPSKRIGKNYFKWNYLSRISCWWGDDCRVKLKLLVYRNSNKIISEVYVKDKLHGRETWSFDMSSVPKNPRLWFGADNDTRKTYFNYIEYGPL